MDLEVFNLNEEEDIVKKKDEKDGLTFRDISFYALSSDVHTPLSPPRPTQTNIGLQLVSENSANERWGVSKEQYGGVGPKYCNDPKYRDTRRTIWHARTGLHEEVAPSVTPGNRLRMVLKNKSFFASPIIEVGYDAYNTWLEHNVDRSNQQVHQSLFPRSIVYELDYIKNENRKVMLAALEREREAFEEKKMRKRNQANLGKAQGEQHPITTGNEDPCKTGSPFWWPDKSGKTLGAQKEPQTNDLLYTAHPVAQPVEKADVQRDMQLEDPQEYQPGEIHKGTKAPMDTKKHCSAGEWTPKDPNFHKGFSPQQAPMATPLQDHLAGIKQTGPENYEGKPVQGQSPQDPVHHVDCRQPLGCQCHNELVHKHLGQVATSTIWRPVIPHEKAVAAEVTPGGCMSVTGICGTNSFKQGEAIEMHKAVNVNEYEYQFPGKEIQYTPYSEQERQDELFKCGHRLWTWGTRWMERNRDPLPPKRPSKPPSPWST